MKKFNSFDNHKEILKFLPKEFKEYDEEILDEALDQLIEMGFMQIDIDNNRLVLTPKGNKQAEDINKEKSK